MHSMSSDSGDGAAGHLAVLLGDGHDVHVGVDHEAAVGHLLALGAEVHEVHAHLRGDEHEGDADLGGVADEGELAVLDLLALGQVLDHGQEVAQLLRGVVEVGHAVDDRRGGVLRQVHHVGVAVHAGHEDVDERAHDAGGVLEGLVAAQLDGARAEELRMAARGRSWPSRRRCGAGGHLLEDHAERLVLEDQRVAAALLDHQPSWTAPLDHVEQLFLGEVVGVDVVLHCHGSSYGIGGPRHAVGSRISWRPLSRPAPRV